MFLVVVDEERHERRWYGTPVRDVVTIGAAAEGDIQITGHNISARHVRLHFETRGVQIEIRNAYRVRLDGRAPRGDCRLDEDSTLAIGPWHIRLERSPPSGIEPRDEAFFERLENDDDRAVYADSLEDRGRTAEAELIRWRATAPTLAVQTPPKWRRRFLPIALEGCAGTECPQRWTEHCRTCGRDVPIFGHLGAARDHALKGHPVALDPAVRRWPNDLRVAVVKRPAIEMGQPSRR